jgi:hypothetical protein
MPSPKRACAAIFAAATVCGCSDAAESPRPGGTILDLVLPKATCVISLQNSTNFYTGPDGQMIPLTGPQCARANEEGRRAESEAQANTQAQRAVTPPIVAHPAAPQPPKYEPRYSEKIEADNGAVYRVDLNGTRYFANGVEAGVYDEGRGGTVPMYFDCAGHMGELGDPMSYVPPRSVGARIATVACAAAEQNARR